MCKFYRKFVSYTLAFIATMFIVSLVLVHSLLLWHNPAVALNKIGRVARALNKELK